MAKEKKYKVAVTVGVFDCFHHGHANLLNEMGKVADRVVVFIHDDISTYENKKRFPVQPLQQRVNNMVATGLANYVVMLHSADPSERLFQFLKTEQNLRGDVVYMRGDDWPEFPGKQMLVDLGIPIELIKYTEGISTTQIRKEVGV